MSIKPSSAMTDRNYGREAYIADCVEKLKQGKEVSITCGAFYDISSLPPALAEKYKQKTSYPCGWFDGFDGAKEEILKRVAEIGLQILLDESPQGTLLKPVLNS